MGMESVQASKGSDPKFGLSNSPANPALVTPGQMNAPIVDGFSPGASLAAMPTGGGSGGATAIATGVAATAVGTVALAGAMASRHTINPLVALRSPAKQAAREAKVILGQYKNLEKTLAEKAAGVRGAKVHGETTLADLDQAAIDAIPDAELDKVIAAITKNKEIKNVAGLDEKLYDLPAHRMQAVQGTPDYPGNLANKVAKLNGLLKEGLPKDATTIQKQEFLTEAKKQILDLFPATT